MKELIQTYWPVASFLLAYVVTVAWALIKMYFKIAEMEKHHERHDQSDKQMKDELIELIDRNKKATDEGSQILSTKLEAMHTTLVELNLMTKLLLENKIKHE